VEHRGDVLPRLDDDHLTLDAAVFQVGGAKHADEAGEEAIVAFGGHHHLHEVSAIAERLEPLQQLARRCLVAARQVVVGRERHDDDPRHPIAQIGRVDAAKPHAVARERVGRRRGGLVSPHALHEYGRGLARGRHGRQPEAGQAHADHAVVIA
jgi:hypothetical protein